MKPILFNLSSGLTISILAQNREDSDKTWLFQLYASNTGKTLCDLNYYFGLISFEPASQQFYYSSENKMISTDDILQLTDFIKTNFLDL